jgi:hypothetical protein
MAHGTEMPLKGILPLSVLRIKNIFGNLPWFIGSWLDAAT